GGKSFRELILNFESKSPFGGGRGRIFTLSEIILKCVKSSPYPLQRGTQEIYSLRYSRISPGWQSSSLHIASRVENRMALALPFFRMEILAMVIPTFSAISVTD